jgi:hypothetical protein
VLTGAVEATKTYSIIGLTYATVAAATTGCDWRWNGIPANALIFSHLWKHDSGANATTGLFTLQDGTLVDSAAFNVTGQAWVEGFIYAGDGGTLAQQMASENTNDVTVQPNSFLHLEEVELVPVTP